MIRFLAGVVVGSLGATYLIGMLLPATREERPRDPLPGRRDPFSTDIRLPSNEWDAFVARLDAPPVYLPKLAALLRGDKPDDDTWTGP